MQRISVTKCQGTGNDFVLLDARGQEPRAYGPLAKYLCDRRFGVGADGLLVLSDAASANADVQMQIFNADGSEAEMCGNGVRCVARYVHEGDPQRTCLRVETPAGIIETTTLEHDGERQVRVEMGVPQFLDFPSGQHQQRLTIANEEATSYLVSMGNPHVTIFIDKDPKLIDLFEMAAVVDGWRLFPAQTNVEVAQLRSDGVSMRIRERGVGETWACGTGACAVAAAAIASDRARSPLAVSSMGGTVNIEWGGRGEPLVLTGPAEIVFQADVLIPEKCLLAAVI